MSAITSEMAINSTSQPVKAELSENQLFTFSHGQIKVFLDAIELTCDPLNHILFLKNVFTIAIQADQDKTAISDLLVFLSECTPYQEVFYRFLVDDPGNFALALYYLPTDMQLDVHRWIAKNEPAAIKDTGAYAAFFDYLQTSPNNPDTIDPCIKEMLQGWPAELNNALVAITLKSGNPHSIGRLLTLLPSENIEYGPVIRALRLMAQVESHDFFKVFVQIKESSSVAICESLNHCQGHLAALCAEEKMAECLRLNLVYLPLQSQQWIVALCPVSFQITYMDAREWKVSDRLRLLDMHCYRHSSTKKRWEVADTIVQSLETEQLDTLIEILADSPSQATLYIICALICRIEAKTQMGDIESFTPRQWRLLFDNTLLPQPQAIEEILHLFQTLSPNALEWLRDNIAFECGDVATSLSELRIYQESLIAIENTNDFNYVPPVMIALFGGNEPFRNWFLTSVGKMEPVQLKAFGLALMETESQVVIDISQTLCTEYMDTLLSGCNDKIIRDFVLTEFRKRSTLCSTLKQKAVSLTDRMQTEGGSEECRVSANACLNAFRLELHPHTEKWHAMVHKYAATLIEGGKMEAHEFCSQLFCPHAEIKSAYAQLKTDLSVFGAKPAHSTTAQEPAPIESVLKQRHLEALEIARAAELHAIGIYSVHDLELLDALPDAENFIENIRAYRNQHASLANFWEAFHVMGIGTISALSEMQCAVERSELLNLEAVFLQLNIRR